VKSRSTEFKYAAVPFFYALGALFMILLFAAPARCQEQSGVSIADLQKELGSWQDKIKDLQDKIAKEKAAAADEVSAFRSYLQTTAGHKADLEAQNDSISADIAASKKLVDSLEQSAENRKITSAATDNRVEEMRLALLGACGDLKDFYNSLPPSNVRATSATLDFLKGELESRTVTVSEAVERYWQILGTLDDAASSMDTYVGASPVPSMAGQAYFVRIGLVYLALVSEEGKTAFLWSAAKGAEDGSWQPVKDLLTKASLWDAVRIRDRKIVPKIVGLPFDHPLIVRAVDETGKEKRGPGL